jgi:hypothetical protein
VTFRTTRSRVSLRRKRIPPYTHRKGRTEEELLAKRNELMSRDIDQTVQLRSYSVDLDKKRQIDLTFWAPTESAAKVFVEACKRRERQRGTW